MPGRGWAYIGALLGAGVSIAANVAHSYVPPAGAAPDWTPHAGAVVSAVFWPAALLVASEILGRVVWPAGLPWLLIRFGGLGPVALVAALVSYRHLSGLLNYYGEGSTTAALGPLAVDGLMVMASGALLATRLGPAAPMSTAPVSDTAARPPTPVTPPELDATAAAANSMRPTKAAKGAPKAAPRPTNGAPIANVERARRISQLREADPPMSTTAIAAELGISERTVRRDVARNASRAAGAGADVEDGIPA
jgi:hypothetical protein